MTTIILLVALLAATAAILGTVCFVGSQVMNAINQLAKDLRTDV